MDAGVVRVHPGGRRGAFAAAAFPLRIWDSSAEGLARELCGDVFLALRRHLLGWHREIPEYQRRRGHARRPYGDAVFHGVHGVEPVQSDIRRHLRELRADAGR